MSERAAKPKDVDSYIASADTAARPILEELRGLIKSSVPKVEEGISYGIPFYKYHGQLGGFAAYKNHVSVGFGSDVVETKDRKALEAKGYTLGKGTLLIEFDQKVPTTAIRRILKAKAKMNEAKSSARTPSGARSTVARDRIR